MAAVCVQGGEGLLRVGSQRKKKGWETIHFQNMIQIVGFSFPLKQNKIKLRLAAFSNCSTLYFRAFRASLNTIYIPKLGSISIMLQINLPMHSLHPSQGVAIATARISKDCEQYLVPGYYV